MRKTAVFFLSVMLVVGIVGLANAGEKKVKKDKPSALATIEGISCVEQDIGPYGFGLLAKWSWTNGTVQTKFGGDAVYMAYVSIDGGEEELVAIELELSQFDPEVSLDFFAGKMIYRCTTSESSETGECFGVALGIEEAIMMAVEEKFPEAVTIDYGDYYFAELVNVKAMNPGVESKRQNYPLVNVCYVEEPEEVVTP